MFSTADPKKRKALVRTLLCLALGTVLSLILILPLRGLMNAASRTDFIFQRLDDYPRMYENYRTETQEWWTWWKKADYEKRAEQAAFIFESDEKRRSEKEKLDHLTEMLNVEYVSVVSAADCPGILEQKQSEGLSTYTAALHDGRILILGLDSRLHKERMSSTEDSSYFLSQIQAGLPGHVLILHDGAWDVYPKDEDTDMILEMADSMLESGKLDPDGLRREAENSEDRVAQKVVINSRTEKTSGRKYFLYCAAYADNDDFVINAAPVSGLARFARKRSWSLWFLCCAIMILLARCLWKSRLYLPDPEGNRTQERRTAFRKARPALLFAFFLTIASVFVVQKLSSANLSQQGATDQAEYLKNILERESARAEQICEEFDELYANQAQTAATVLSDNPRLIDLDSLYSLDQALGGSGLRVYDASGELLASDDILQMSIGERSGSATDEMPEEKTGETSEEPLLRHYRAAMVDENGRTTGWTELEIAQKQLDDLLWSTTLKELIGDLHILDTLHVVVVESRQDGKIVAGTWESWVGGQAEQYGIHPQLFYDGYEGIVNFEGSRCYSVVFGYGNDYVVVGSEDESALVFTGGILLLVIPLMLILTFAVYRPVTGTILNYQRSQTLPAPAAGGFNAENEQPRLWEYLRLFMLAVFLLSVVLFFVTRGNPAGLTYNILRGTWVRGVNIATVTTCIMLTSVVFAVRALFDILLTRIGEYLSPKGKTIWKLLDSGFTYLGSIALIIYTLSMFGVNTTALVGGVGVTALIFTLGANSLMADVVAGIFIIFESDFTVGDMVVIDDFRGIVMDIGIRTTKLVDDNNRDIRIINNSRIVELTNQSREKSTVIIDIPVSMNVGLERGEQVLQQAVDRLPEKFPKIIGTPEVWGVSQLPSKHPVSGKLSGLQVRIAFDCLEHDKEMLTYQVYSELVSLVAEINAE